MKLDFSHVTELSHHIFPGKENFPCSIRNFDVCEFIPSIVHKPDEWYILTDIRINSHCATHIEFPFHHNRDGVDARRFPLDRLMGPAVVLDFSQKAHLERITMDDIMEQYGKIEYNDIILIRTGMDQYYHETNWPDAPVLDPEALRFLIQTKHPRMMGTDAVGFEVPDDLDQPCHTMIFNAGMAYIESMTNLELVQDKRFFMVTLPLPIEGCDASPIRVIAVPMEK